MSILIDTHAFLWWLGGNRRMTPKAKKMISTSADVWVSAASAWEICTKVRIGKLPEAAAIANDVVAAVLSQGFRPLAIEFAHAEEAGRLISLHRDPFGRIIAVQARQGKLQLVSADTAFETLGVPRYW
jgi:PIN domain nuclease of toxin-antitoxin system